MLRPTEQLPGRDRPNNGQDVLPDGCLVTCCSVGLGPGVHRLTTVFARGVSRAIISGLSFYFRKGDEPEGHTFQKLVTPGRPLLFAN